MFEFASANVWTLATIAVVIGCAFPTIAIVLEHQRKSRQAELDHQIKRDLIAQGRSPEEIQAVLDMSSKRKA